MRNLLRQRLVLLEAALASRAPIEPAVVWHCHGETVTAADRRAAANEAGRRGTPNAKVIFFTVVDGRRRDRTPEPEPSTPTLNEVQRARLDVEVTAGRITRRQAERLQSVFANGLTILGAVEHALGTTARLDARVTFLTEQLTRAGALSPAITD